MSSLLHQVLDLWLLAINYNNQLDYLKEASNFSLYVKGLYVSRDRLGFRKQEK